MSGGATFIGMGLDFYEGAKSDRKGYSLLRTLLFLKGGIGLGSGVLTLATTFTYSAPLVARLAGRATAGTAVKAVGERAAAIIGLRILGMAAGSWMTVGLFGIQIIVWFVTPNALQDWIDHSAFGRKRDRNGFKNTVEQDKALHEALVEMGLK